MITKIISAIFSVILSIIGFFLSLIVSGISLLIPNSLLASALSGLASFYQLLVPGLIWIFDAFCITDLAIDMLVGFVAWKIAVYMVVHPISFVIHWYNKLKP